ncbi:MAG: hypothetical protein HS103_16775 [Anaerolineales bacterium]|jgi:hypothetical protein|nr:hypothetical protein [Anaerolineales bacterium]
MKLSKHLTEQPFILATGLAALVHSTWSLGTLFTGAQPDIHTDGLLPYLFWLIPALLIAFAMDVGQIATSAEIRAGQRTPTRYVTFIVFAIATYYLQWTYMIHHMPALELAPGVRQSWGGVATLLRDSAIWIVPALLPLSTTLYTLSGGVHRERNDNALPTTPSIPVPDVTNALMVVEKVVPLEKNIQTEEADAYHVKCPCCEWHGMYQTKRNADNALRAHSRHCAAIHAEVES